MSEPAASKKRAAAGAAAGEHSPSDVHTEKVATITRKKSTFNKITEMITNSPILEPLRSEHPRFFNTFSYFHLISLPLDSTTISSVCVHFAKLSLFYFSLSSSYSSSCCSIDRPQRQSKLKSSASNASDTAAAAAAADTKASKSKSLLGSVKPLNMLETLKNLDVRRLLHDLIRSGYI